MISCMISRTQIIRRVERALSRNPVVALIGPRQCGKTTLAREFLVAESSNYFDLEDPVVALALEEPMSTLKPLSGLVVIDEAQRRPEIFPVLRVLADRVENPARFLILGSASPDLSRQAAESLAGRVEIIEMGGFDLAEVGEGNSTGLWHRGGFPRSYLALDDSDSYAWRQQFARTFLERDLAQLGFGMSPQSLGRFWTMLAHYHGQIWNGNEIASSMGVSATTARRYLDVLEQTFMVRRLQPWFANLGKRLVKTPKIYLRDSGLFHALLGVRSPGELAVHPKLGASWEGFAIEQILRFAQDETAYFFAIHSGSELDLYFPSLNIGVEVKRQDAPRLTRSMLIAQQDLQLEQLWVVYPGTRSYPLAKGVDCLPLHSIAEIFKR